MSVPLSILYLLIIHFMEFVKVWAKHNFYYIRYISVYIQPGYLYLIFRSVNGDNMMRVILHSVRPSFWKKRDFPHALRCGSTESGCEISVPWWLILADRGKMTSVWIRDRDTGDTSEGDTLPPATSGLVWELIIFGHFFLQIFVFCLIIVNKSNYLNKITSEVAKLAITITHSDISRDHSPLGILSKVYLKSGWQPSWISLIHRPWAIPILASIANRESIICSISVPNCVALGEFAPRYP